jgi:hypothetical protein
VGPLELARITRTSSYKVSESHWPAILAANPRISESNQIPELILDVTAVYAIASGDEFSPRARQ